MCVCVCPYARHSVQNICQVGDTHGWNNKWMGRGEETDHQRGADDSLRVFLRE